MSAHRLRRAVAAALCAMPLAVAACFPLHLGHRQLAPGHHHRPPAQVAILRSLLLTAADFPAGWTQDTQADAAGVQGTPACVADLVAVLGSAARVNAVFVGPGQSPPAVIQTVSAFPPERRPLGPGPAYHLRGLRRPDHRRRRHRNPRGHPAAGQPAEAGRASPPR